MQVKVKICEFFSMISFCCKKIMCFWVVRYVVGSIWICVFLGLYVYTYTCFCECARIRFSARVCVCAPTWCLWEGRWAWSRSDQRSSSHTSASGRLRWWRRCFPMYRRRCGEKLLWDVKHSCFTLLASLTHTHHSCTPKDGVKFKPVLIQNGSYFWPRLQSSGCLFSELWRRIKAKGQDFNF